MESETVQIAQPQPRFKKKAFIIILGSLLTVGAVGAGGLSLYTRDSGVMLEGVRVGQLDLSGLRLDEARSKLEQYMSSIIDRPLEFNVKSETVNLPLKTLGISLDLEQTVGHAYAQGREGNLLHKATLIWQAHHGNTLNLPLNFHWDNEILQKTLQTTFAAYNQPTRDAGFKITPDNRMEIEKEIHGQQINFTLLAEKIKGIDPFHPTPIDVPIEPAAPPKLTAEQLEAAKITGLLAKYSTHFDPGLANRTENIRLAAKALDGKVLAPGETFSFNRSVGERTASAGYKEALIIVGDEFTPGLGGGVCQVSSTLYNAALMAKMDILERHPHSLAITYVPPGQDATVAYPDLDLKFKNTTSGYVLLRSSVLGNTLTFEVYGHI